MHITERHRMLRVCTMSYTIPDIGPCQAFSTDSFIRLAHFHSTCKCWNKEFAMKYCIKSTEKVESCTFAQYV